MTIEIAITGERQPPVRLHVEYGGGTVEAANQIILALEAREPKLQDGVPTCPSCGRRVYNSDADAWCGHCGQAIDWED